MGRKRKWPPEVHDERGRARMWYNGAWHYLGPYGSEEAEAARRKLLLRWEADPNAPAPSPDDLLLSRLFRDFLASDRCPPGEGPQRVRRVWASLREAHLATPAAEFDAPALAAWQSSLCRAGYSVAYVREMVMWVRVAFKWAASTKRVPVTQYQELLTVAGPRAGRGPGQARPARRVSPARPADVERVLPLLRRPPAAMVRLQLLAGFRPSELFRLTPRQVHRAGVVDVPEVGEVDLDALGVWVYLPVDKDGNPLHKTERHKKPRWVILGAQAQAVLAPFLDRGPDVPCFSPREAVAELNLEKRALRKTPVQPSQRDRRRPGAKARGDRYTRQSYNRAVRRACDKLGVAPWTPYQLRHRHAADVDAALGLDHARAALGHSSAQTTVRYAKQSFAKAAEVARTLG